VSYIKEQFEMARDSVYPNSCHETHIAAFDEGLKRGFTIAIKAYGIWKDGRQVIGCQDTPVKEIIAKEFGE